MYKYTQYYRDGPGGIALCVPPIITFSLWCTRLLASLVCRYGQKVTLVKNGSVICPGKGVKLKILLSKFFLSFLFWFKSCISLTAALTNVKLGREIKLCVTNIVMVKIFVGEPQKTFSDNTFLMAYVRARNQQRKTLWKTKLDTWINFRALTANIAVKLSKHCISWKTATNSLSQCNMYNVCACTHYA